jgi:hypothetical protein
MSGMTSIRRRRCDSSVGLGRYPEFQAKGWQIGSGPTEATCKTLTARLKGSGMRWDADNAEAIMALEALSQCGQWEQDWKSQLRPTG